MKGKTKQSYPEVGRIVRAAIEHKQELFRKKHKKELSTLDIVRDLNKAGKAGMSTAGLWNYQNGHRAVPKAKAEAMAKYFFERDPEGASKFVSGLEEAAKNGQAAHRSVADRLAEGQPLRIDVTSYPPFSKRIGDLVDHLCRLSALARDFPGRERDFDMRQALWRDEIDLAIGYFANLNRGVQVHFWPTTIKIGLGAVVLRQHEKNKELIKQVLADEKRENRENQSQLCPVLVRREVGAIHCLETLQYPEDDVKFVENMTAENLLAKNVAVKLKKTQEATSKIAVAVLDEYTSFQVLREMDALGVPAVPVLPLSSRQAAREWPRRQLPASFLSIGCSRKQAELRDVMNQALNLFLATEVESNALRLALLHEDLLSEVNYVAKKYYPEYEPEGQSPELQKEAAAKAFGAAYRYVLYVLGLDYQSLENVPRFGLSWEPILKRARERVLSALANQKETISDQISLFAGPDAAPSEKKFNELCEALDLKIHLHGVQREYVREDREILVRTIQDCMHGLPVGLPIENGKEGGRVENLAPRVEPIPGEDAKDKEVRAKKLRAKMRALDGFLRDLQEFYAKRVGGDDASEEPTKSKSPDTGVLTKILKFRQGLEQYIKPADPSSPEEIAASAGQGQTQRSKVFGESTDDRVLLASFSKKPTRYLGSACLRPYPKHSHPIWLELFYLWVRADYRQLAVGDQIILEAKKYAQTTTYPYTFLVVEVLQTLNEAVTYFRKRDFEEHGRTDDGRLLLRWEIPKRKSLAHGQAGPI